MLTRRALAPLGLLAALCTPARAQPAAAGVRMPPLPCATQPGDIVGLLLDGSGAPAGTVVTFGQAFAPGALPRDALLAARLADGRAVPAQADIRNRHPDGSARFAVVSLAAPALRRGERAGVVLARGPAGAAPPLDVAAALAGRAAVLEILPPDGGTPWRADLLDLFRAGLAGGRAWQAGPLAVEARGTVRIPAAAVGGGASPRLVADVAIRADGTLWVAAWVRNDLAMEAQGGPIRYGLRLLLDGHEMLAASSMRQAQYQGWGTTRAALRGQPAPPPPLVRADAAYLADLGAVPRYDVAAGIDEALLARMAQAMAAPDWAVPFARRGLTQYMPTSGGRPEIGPATLWQAAWLVSGDPRAAAHALGQAEAAGAVPWHYWDEAHRTWLNSENYPALWTELRDQTGRPGDRRAPALAQLFPPPDQVGGWRVDDAHQPDLSTVPYLLTGQRWILDNLQAQSATAVMGTFPPSRQNAAGNVVNGPQPRAQAWSLRQVDNAAWLSPDGSVEQAYFGKVSAYNWQWLAAKLPEWTARQGEAFGWIPGAIGAPGVLSPWQQDYFATTTAAAAARGNQDARRVLEWQANFLVGRFTHEAQGFPPPFGVAFLLAAADPTTEQAIEGNVYQTWRGMAEAQVARNLAGPGPWVNANYNQLALASLAAIRNVLGNAQALEVFRTLQARRIPGTSLAEVQAEPTFSIVPRDFTRAAAPLPACQPAAGRG